MRTIFLDQQIKADELRAREQSLIKKENQMRRKMAHKKRPGLALNTYTLYESGRPTDEKKDMEHIEAVTMNRALTAKFCDHVRACLDAGVKNEEKLKQWRCTEHWSDKAKKA